MGIERRFVVWSADKMMADRGNMMEPYIFVAWNYCRSHEALRAQRMLNPIVSLFLSQRATCYVRARAGGIQSPKAEQDAKS